MGITLLETLKIIQSSLIYLSFRTFIEEFMPRQTLPGLQFHQRKFLHFPTSFFLSPWL